MKKEYLEQLKHLHDVCNPTDPDAKQISDWAKQTIRKFGWKYEFPEGW
jgi:hypothetical protein